MFGNVIVGVDGLEPGRDALGLALDLASSDRLLTLAHVEVVPWRPDPDSGARSLDLARQRSTDQLVSLRNEFEVDARFVSIEARSVVAGLHELVEGDRADLLVIGRSRRDDYERTFIGDDTRAVLKDAPCTTAVAPAGYAKNRRTPARIGAAYDGSRESDQALALARTLARELGAELSAFEAVPVPLALHDPRDPQPEIDARVGEARRRLAALGDVKVHAAPGEDAAEELARYGASVDLLVLGSHKYRPTDALWSGSTAQRLADHAPCALLVLSPGRD